MPQVVGAYHEKDIDLSDLICDGSSVFGVGNTLQIRGIVVFNVKTPGRPTIIARLTDDWIRFPTKIELAEDTLIVASSPMTFIDISRAEDPLIRYLPSLPVTFGGVRSIKLSGDVLHVGSIDEGRIWLLNIRDVAMPSLVTMSDPLISAARAIDVVDDLVVLAAGTSGLVVLKKFNSGSTAVTPTPHPTTSLPTSTGPSSTETAAPPPSSVGKVYVPILIARY